ncbi:hypothetical protein K0M31_007650 [Melipona bicolor]|uniref:Uncharacterized protein n=1 Tax=Melipona bicolor TaxID=60889 RepID=A0AA40GC62_9HYME|nr:hypothetical protein K0M31_007650 [Melipona bicolor]
MIRPDGEFTTKYGDAGAYVPLINSAVDEIPHTITSVKVKEEMEENEKRQKSRGRGSRSR